MNPPPDAEAIVHSLTYHHRAFMEKVVNLMRRYKTRTEELEMLMFQKSMIKVKDAQSQTNESESCFQQRFDRRTFSESGVSLCAGFEQMPSSFPDIWNFSTEGLGNLSGASGINEGWSNSINPSSFSPLVWCDASALAQRSPPSDSQTLSDSDLRTDSSLGLTATAPAPILEDSFDLRDIEEAIRESQAVSDENWEMAANIKEKKFQKAQPINIPASPIQRELNTRFSSRRIKACSESSVPLRKAIDERKLSRNIIAELPSVFVGRWFTVKSCATGANNDGRWKEAQKKERKREPRVCFRKGHQEGTYLVSHKKFTIKDAIFYEHCGGQRCIVLKDRSNSILIRNKQHTYTFTITDNQLLETFREGGVEYKVLSAKE